jgi:phosphoglycerol transferase MdoB-like AlkP superfamily enzyme
MRFFFRSRLNLDGTGQLGFFKSVVVLFFLSLGVGFIPIIINKSFFQFGGYSLWLLLDLVMESFFVLGLYAFRRSIKAVLTIQLVLGISFRVINSLKCRYLEIPVLPSDLYLLNDLIHAIPTHYVIGAIAIIGGIVLFTVWLSFKNAQLPKRWEWGATIPAFLFCGWVIILPSSYVATFDELTKNEQFAIPFLIKERGQTIGVPISFTIDFARFLRLRFQTPSLMEVQTSTARLQKDAAKRAPASSIAPPTKPRNIYVLISESFWDPSPFVPFLKTPFFDPDFSSLWSASGQRYFFSPTFGGGTSNVEFEVLCGIPAQAITRGVIFQTALTQKAPCLPNLLRSAGYRTFAFHSFSGSFYNRPTAYNLLGFDEFFAIADLSPNPAPGDFIPDQRFIDLSVTKAIQKAEGQPHLTYILTFAGHWPYAWMPFYQKHIVLPNSGNSESAELLERNLNINYIASTTIANLVKKIELIDPSALIVVFGDHLPVVVNEISVELPESAMLDATFYKTPLLIVDRPNLGKSNPWNEKKITPGFDLTLEILDRIGFPVHENSHFSLFGNSRKVYRPLQNGAVLVQEQNVVPGFVNGPFAACTPKTRLPTCEDAQQWLDDARNVGRDLILGEQYFLKSSATK